MSERVAPQLLEQINTALAAQLGLSFPSNRMHELERGILRACPDLAFGSALDCLEALQAGSLSRRQVELLASHLTIGETYFLREPKTFHALETQILPALIERRRTSMRILRFWSAGASTGEEAYSLAILLQRAVPDWREWNITILATDINPTALQRAEEAVYGKWSFRSVPAGFRERHFEPAGAERYRVREDIRRMVRFSYLNLADLHSYPSLATNTMAMDVIFCRNVLMYFPPDIVRRVGRQFSEALTEEGWLVTSPAEASRQFFPDLEPHNFPGTIFFRKASALRPAAPEPESPAAVIDADWQRSVRRGPVRRFEPPLARSAPPCPEAAARPARAAAHGDELETLEREARAHANRGELAQALEACRQLLARDALNLAGLFLNAEIHQEMGETRAAIETLRKVLFLDGDYAMAHFVLAGLYRLQGRTGEARRHYRRAARLLERLDPGDLPPASEGMNAARLRHIVTANLESLGSVETGTP